MRAEGSGLGGVMMFGWMWVRLNGWFGISWKFLKNVS